MFDMRNKKGLSLSGAKRTDNLSRIKKEAAEIFGSCVASPKMTIQRHSEAEPNNPRKVQHNDWILHFAFAPFRMTIPAQALALILTFGAIGESRAECYAKEHFNGGFCYDTWNPGVADNCGDGCTYDYANGKLTVYSQVVDVSSAKFSLIILLFSSHS